MSLASVPTRFEHKIPCIDGSAADVTNVLQIADRWKFEPEMWVPAIKELVEVSTVEESFSSFGNMALRMANTHGSYRLQDKSLVAKTNTGIKARFSYRVLTNGGDENVSSPVKMRSAEVGFLRIGIPTPVPDRANAYAVVDEVDNRYERIAKILHHQVFSTPFALLSDRLRYTTQALARDTADALHAYYPGFELHDRLHDAGICFDE